MWQRIQTLWLLLAGIAMTVLLFKPLALMVGPAGQGYMMNVLGLHSPASGELLKSTWGLFVLDAIIVLCSFGIIFLFKKRILQIRLCIFNILLTIGFIAYFIIQSWSIASAQNLDLAFRFWLSMPIISILLHYMAIRAIGADEAMVRAAERLR